MLQLSVPRLPREGWRLVRRKMSIMERYKKLRPAPSPAPEPWARPDLTEGAPAEAEEVTFFG
ncbi:unnamed protein product [Effrenium voratum]|nr:unnamed protein product [Effrenium voratum]